MKITRKTRKGQKQVPADALTVLEASTNAFSIHGRLAEIGQIATVLASDTLSGAAQKDRINDRIDARNLAFVYARNPNIREVHVPSKQYRYFRDLFFTYRNAVKDTVRNSNRIWSFCSGHDLALPKRSFKRLASAVGRDYLLTIGFEKPRDFIEHRFRSAFLPTATMEL